MDALPTTFLIEKPLVYASIYELSTIVFGSEGLARLSTGDDADEFDKLRVRHEIAQASKLLIEVAVVLRNFMDSGFWPTDSIHEVRSERRPEVSVGVVREENKEEKSLSFRQACNKIIHAENISFGMKEISGKMNCLNGSVKLRGSWYEKVWVSDVQVADFIRMAVRQL